MAGEGKHKSEILGGPAEEEGSGGGGVWDGRYGRKQKKQKEKVGKRRSRKKKKVKKKNGPPRRERPSPFEALSLQGPEPAYYLTLKTKIWCQTWCSHSWCWPNMVLAKDGKTRWPNLVLAKVGNAHQGGRHTTFGIWPDHFWPRPLLVRSRSCHL